MPDANYLWLSYFYSYLNDTGRAGCNRPAGRGTKSFRQLIQENEPTTQRGTCSRPAASMAMTWRNQ
jgi:hypothetical protein